MAKKTKLKATPEEQELYKRLKKLRELKGDCRMAFYYDILAYLDYEKELSTCKIDALFIKAVREKLGEFNIESDIVLMALGLLDGCSYNVSLQIGGRREIFLKESTYLKQDEISYDDASDDDKDRYADNLRKSEDKGLLILSKFLITYKNRIEDFLNDIDGYIDDGVAIFPTPSYIKRDGMREKAQEAVIKYSYLGKETFTAKQEIVIKNNECQIEVDLSKELANKLARNITLAALPLVLIFVLVGFSLSNHVQGQSSNPPQSSNMVEGWTAADAKSDKNL